MEMAWRLLSVRVCREARPNNSDAHESVRQAMLCRLRSHHVGETYDHQWSIAEA